MARYSDSQEGYLTREEVLEWLKSKVEELELELRALKTIAAILDTGQQALVGERVEEVKQLYPKPPKKEVKETRPPRREGRRGRREKEE